MRDKTKQINATFVTILMMFSFVGFATSAECASQDCATDISVVIGNTAPTIPYVATGAITLTGGSATTVYVIFNASDTNGYAQLDHSTAQVEIYKAGEATRTSSVCEAIENTTLQSVFNCTVEMQFYDANGADWAVNASISDDDASKVENKTLAVTVNALDYVSSDATSVSNTGAWDGAVAGTNDLEAGGTITITNGGNQDYTTITMKGYNATGTADSEVITAESFSIDGETAQTTGQVYMVDGVATDVTGVLSLPSHGASVTEEIFFYVDLEAGLNADTYTSDTNWELSVSA